MKFTGILLNLDEQQDAHGDIFSDNCKINIADNVTCNINFSDAPKDCLGPAQVYRDGNTLKYEIDIPDTNIPKEALDAMFPAVGGKILNRKDNQILEIEVNQVGLSISGNADPRIKSLGEQK